MSRKCCLAIVFICVALLGGTFSQGNVWGQAPEKPQIAFARGVNVQHWEIHLMDINGKNVRQLTKGIAQDSDPSWSPGRRTDCLLLQTRKRWYLCDGCRW